MTTTRLSLRHRVEGAAGRLLARLPAPLQRRLTREPPIAIDGQVLDPALHLMLRLRRRRGAHGYCAPNVPEARERIRREALAFRGRPTRVGAVRELSVAGGAGLLRARHYAPFDEGTRPAPLLVYLHGGGFAVCDLETHDEPCRLLCRHAGVHVLSVEYRLAPEHPFPAALDDALAALDWAQRHAASLGADPRHVSVGGDSAGGNLAAVVSRLAMRAGAPPAAQLLVYPATDGDTIRPSHHLFGEGLFLDYRDRDAFARHYAESAGVRPTDPRVSPLHAADLGGLPPALVVVAHFDILRDEGEAYAAALRASGTVVAVHRAPTLPHAFINLTGLSPAARRETIAVARAWRAHLHAHAVATGESEAQRRLA